MEENKYVKRISVDKTRAIIKNSVQALANKPIISAEDMKKRFVSPIINIDNEPSLADEVNRIADEAERAISVVKSEIPLTIECLMDLTTQNLHGTDSSGITYADLVAKQGKHGQLTVDNIVSTWGRSWFNRDAVVGDEFFATARTKDDIIVALNCEVIEVDESADSYGRPYWGITDIEIVYNPYEIPLVPNRPIYVNRTYEQIRADIANGKDNDSYWSSLDDTYYAFLKRDFSREPIVGDKFTATCSSLDGYIFNISAQVTEVKGNEVYFKILDKGLDEIDDFVLLYNPNAKELSLVLEATVEFNNKDYNTLFAAYKNNETADSFAVEWFNKKPKAGDRFFAIGVTRDKRNVAFTAEVTGIDEYNDAEFKFIDFVLLGEDYPMLNYTMGFRDISVEELTAYADGKYTFEGKGKYAFAVELFNIPPRVGNNFFGTAKVHPTGSEYPSVITYTAEVTGINEYNDVEYKFIDVTLLHNGEVDKAIAELDDRISKVELLKIVTELPETGETGKFYLVPKTDVETNDAFDEWLWVNKGTEEKPNYAWEFVGTKTFEIDSDLFVKFTDYASQDKAGVVKVNPNNSGLQASDGDLRLFPASPIAIELRNQTGINYANRSPITHGNLNIAVIASLTDDKKILMTDDEKAKACETIGAVKKDESVASNKSPLAYTNDTARNHYLATSYRDYSIYNIPMIYGGTAGKDEVNGYLLTANPVNGYHAANKKYVDDGFVGKSEVSSASVVDTIVRRITDGNINVPITPLNEHSATSRGYVDGLIAQLSNPDATIVLGTKLYRHDINGGANSVGMTIIMTSNTPFTTAAQIYNNVPNDYSNPVSKAFVSMYTGTTTAGQVTCAVGNPGDVNAEYSFANFTMSGSVTDVVTEM